jgi:arylsulfatase A-like enzyme
MTSRLALTLLILTTLRLCHSHKLVAAEATAPQPHIVIFVIDDLGYADVGFNGGREIQTPAIDALAAEGTVLAAHYVQPVCSPTRAALMTGRYATHTGVYTIVRPNARWGLPLDERTLADALRQAGYTTAITGKWHLGEFEPAYRPTARGFDHQYGHYFGAIDYYNHQRDGQVDWYRDDKPLSEDGYSTELIAAEASRLITQHKPVADSKPLFLYVPFNGVHAPLQVPDTYLQPYSALKGNRRTYAGMLAAVDVAIGRITTALRDAGMLDNTLVLFTADNGGPSPGTVTSNGALRAGKGTLYEGGVRGCAFVRWPGTTQTPRRTGSRPDALQRQGQSPPVHPARPVPPASRNPCRRLETAAIPGCRSDKRQGRQKEQYQSRQKESQTDRRNGSPNHNRPRIVQPSRRPR